VPPEEKEKTTVDVSKLRRRLSRPLTSESSSSAVQPTTLLPSPVPPASSIGKKPVLVFDRKRTASKDGKRLVASKDMRNQAEAAARATATHSAALVDCSRWTARDDVALLTAVTHVSDLQAAHSWLKFSSKFTLAEIEQRWYALLYDEMINRTAMEKIRILPADTILDIQSKTIFTAKEEKMIASVANVDNKNAIPTRETFASLLERFPDKFHPARTAAVLLEHWQQLRKWGLLSHQQKGTPSENRLDWEEIERHLEIAAPAGDLPTEERRLAREANVLEGESAKWAVMVEAVTGVAAPHLDASVMAVLRGRIVRFLMKSRQVTVGRSTPTEPVDIDLSLDGPSMGVSRKQAVIKLRIGGDFYISNLGKRSIFVDGKSVVQGNKAKLSNNSLIEISHVRLVFAVNEKLVEEYRQNASKLLVS